MVKRSSWCGWTCSVMVPPGTLRQLKRTTSPLLSSATSVYWMCSPVAGLKKGRNLAGRAVGGGSAHGVGAVSGTVLGELRGRRAARSWNPAAAVPSRSTPAASPVVAARAVPDMVATRTNGPMVSAQPTGR